MDVFDTSTARTTLEEWIFLIICRVPTESTITSLIFLLLLASLFVFFLFGILIWLSIVLTAGDWLLNWVFGGGLLLFWGLEWGHLQFGVVLVNLFYLERWVLLQQVWLVIPATIGAWWTIVIFLQFQIFGVFDLKRWVPLFLSNWSFTLLGGLLALLD